MTLQTGMMLLAAKMPLDMMISKMSRRYGRNIKNIFSNPSVFNYRLVWLLHLAEWQKTE